jgi:hypothetical protein
MIGMHKVVSARSSHWYAVLFGSLLCFLAVSSFWMCNRNARGLRRGVCLASLGIVVTVIVLFL